MKVFRVLDQLFSQSQNCDQLKGLSACLFRNWRAFAYKACVEIPVQSSDLYPSLFLSLSAQFSSYGLLSCTWPRSSLTPWLWLLTWAQDLIINDIRHPCSCSCYTWSSPWQTCQISAISQFRANFLTISSLRCGHSSSVNNGEGFPWSQLCRWTSL